MTWAPNEVLNANAESGSLSLATDGQGIWVAVWDSKTGLLFSRSSDNAVNWSLSEELYTSGENPNLATDGNGNWVAVWMSYDDLSGTIGNDADILVAHSSDNGVTWTPPQALNANASIDNSVNYNVDNWPQLMTDGQGTWITVWTSQFDFGGTIGTDYDLLVSRSLDNGVSWTTPQALDSNAAIDDYGYPEHDTSANLETDGRGNWIAVWISQLKEWSNEGIFVTEETHAAYSADNGITWTKPQVLDPFAFYGYDYGYLYDGSPSAHIETDGKGKWIAAWPSRNEIGNTIGWDLDILTSSFSSETAAQLSLSIEDALPGVIVNKIVGDADGPAGQTILDIVARIVRFIKPQEPGIPIILTVPNNLFDAPITTGFRENSGSNLTPVDFEDVGAGRYRVFTNLNQTMSSGTSTYSGQIVWRFLIPENVSPQDVTISVAADEEVAYSNVRILSAGSVSSIIITNRQLLYELYNEKEVTSLLQQLFSESQGSPHNQNPRSIIYYVDRYSLLAANWDNTTVNYSNENTANEVSREIDELIEDWQDDATLYLNIGSQAPEPLSRPNYLTIIGNDDVVPFYRYDDPSDWEGRWGWNSNINTSIHATDEDFFFTDNPYADINGEDWQTGDVELWNGRILGENARDMNNLLQHGVSHQNRRAAVVMASVDGWELGLELDTGEAGEIADIHNVTEIFRTRGFEVLNDDEPATEVRTIDVMDPYEGGDVNWNSDFRAAANNRNGMDLFFIGSHAEPNRAEIPGVDFSPMKPRCNIIVLGLTILL